MDDKYILSTTRLTTGKRELNRDFERSGVVVKEGFSTDFSSYPHILTIIGLIVLTYVIEIPHEALLFLFLFLIPRFDKVDIAGVVHDWLYYTGQEPRSIADRIWRERAMAGKRSANPAQAWAGWFFLRVGGWYVWRKHRIND